MVNATRKKLDEILEMIRKGATEKEIRTKKFSRNPNTMKEWIEKVSKELTEEEKMLLSFTNIQAPMVLKEPVGLPMKVITKVEDHEKQLEAYNERLEALEAIINGNTQITLATPTNVLIVDDKILKSKAITRSIRVCPEIIDEFNQLAEEHRNFSKTNLFNQALKEFVLKYRK